MIQKIIYINDTVFYKNTTSYAIAKNFNYMRFYKWLKEISEFCPIFISEQYLPAEFDKYKIWDKEVKRTNGKDNSFKAKETLWFIDRRNENESNNGGSTIEKSTVKEKVDDLKRKDVE